MSEIVACPSCGKKNRVPDSAAGVPRCASCHVALPWLTSAVDGTFDDLTSTPMAVLVDLWAPWCGPCRMVAPAVERVARELAGQIKVVKVNVDELPEISSRFGVQGIPTLLVLRDGHPIARQVGALPDTALLSWVRGAIGSAA
jgi:thioredoxin 2